VEELSQMSTGRVRPKILEIYFRLLLKIDFELKIKRVYYFILLFTMHIFRACHAYAILRF